MKDANSSPESRDRPTYEIKWLEMANATQSSFFDFLKNREFCDCTLSAEGKFIEAHRVILASSCLYFKVSFKLPNNLRLSIEIFFHRSCLQAAQTTKIQSFTSTE